MKRVLLLSGATGAGKSSVAKALEDLHKFRRLSSSGYLRSYAESPSANGERLQLQNLGDRLDIETDYLWIVRDVAVPAIAEQPETQHWLLDAVRKPRQVFHFRQQFRSAVRHLHLVAPESVLEERYRLRAQINDTPYEQAIAHPNEVAARSLGEIADRTIDTSAIHADEIAQLAFSLWESV